MNVAQNIRGVKCLVQDSANRFLLVKISYAHKKWTLPGGAVEENESFKQAAVRELREETGIELPTLTFFAKYEGTNPIQHPVQCFYGKTGAEKTAAEPMEIDEIGWFSPDDFPENRSDRIDKVYELFLKSSFAKVAS